MKRMLTLGLVVAAAAVAVPARADEPPPHVPSAPEPPPEPGIVVGQLAAGVATPVALIFLGAVGGPGPLVVLLLSTPLAVGGVVCGIGRASDYYTGGCGASILGAFLGALTVIPAAVIADRLHWNDGGGEVFADSRQLLLMATAWFIVQPVAATFAWHLGKSPLSGMALQPALAARPTLFPAERSNVSGRARGEVTVPLLSIAF